MTAQECSAPRDELPTCCRLGWRVYPDDCPEHGAQVPADLLEQQER